MAEFWKFVTVFLTCAFAFGKLGIPTAVAVFKFNFVKVMLASWSGGITGNIIFTYLSAGIIKVIHNYRVKRNLIHKKRIFTKFNRRVIRIKQKFGLTGIALITPIVGTPVGAFLAERFFRHKRKVIIYLSLSVMLWSVTLYFLIVLFYDSLKGWLI